MILRYVVDSLSPVWTERSPTMRILDPINAESTQSTLQSRLFYPVLSIAITQRLRYLSYWCWVLDHVEEIEHDRALYEKVVLLGSDPHDCPGEGTSDNGTLNPDSGLRQQLADPDVASIPIDSDHVTIGGNDRSRFSSYYSGILYNLLLLENDQTVTPLGRRLAHAYDQAVEFSFEDVQEAVSEESLPRQLIEEIRSSGCFCQVTSKERRILCQAYWYRISPTSEYEDLAFDQSNDPDSLELTKFLKTNTTQLEQEAKEAELMGHGEADYEASSEDLKQFFAEGRPNFVRASLTLLLSTADWTVSQSPNRSPFTNLSDAREVWRLLVHAEYASFAIQSLFIAIQGVVRELGPITPGELLSIIFDSPEFDATANRAISGVETDTENGTDRSTIDRVRDVVYFGEAPSGEFTTAIPEKTPDSSPLGTWEEVQSDLKATDSSEKNGPFELSGTSERAYQNILVTELRSAATVSDYRRVAALASVLSARVGTRYDQYFGSEEMEPFLAWFNSAHEHPGPRSCWDVRSQDLQASPTSEAWDGSAFSQTAAAFAKQWALDNYFEKLFQKIGDSNGRSPQMLHVDTNGELSFDYAANDGALYNGGVPNAPTLKWDRMGDIFYELGLATTNDLHSLEVTELGRDLIAKVTEGVDR